MSALTVYDRLISLKGITKNNKDVDKVLDDLIKKTGERFDKVSIDNINEALNRYKDQLKEINVSDILDPEYINDRMKYDLINSTIKQLEDEKEKLINVPGMNNADINKLYIDNESIYYQDILEKQALNSYKDFIKCIEQINAHTLLLNTVYTVACSDDPASYNFNELKIKSKELKDLIAVNKRYIDK